MQHKEWQLFSYCEQQLSMSVKLCFIMLPTGHTCCDGCLDLLFDIYDFFMQPQPQLSTTTQSYKMLHSCHDVVFGNFMFKEELESKVG